MWLRQLFGCVLHGAQPASGNGRLQLVAVVRPPMCKRDREASQGSGRFAGTLLRLHLLWDVVVVVLLLLLGVGWFTDPRHAPA